MDVLEDPVCLLPFNNSPVETTIAIRLVGNLEEAIDLLLIKTSPSRKLRQPLVGLVSWLVDDVGIEVFGLLVK